MTRSEKKLKAFYADLKEAGRQAGKRILEDWELLVDEYPRIELAQQVLEDPQFLMSGGEVFAGWHLENQRGVWPSLMHPRGIGEETTVFDVDPSLAPIRSMLADKRMLRCTYAPEVTRCTGPLDLARQMVRIWFRTRLSKHALEVHIGSPCNARFEQSVAKLDGWVAIRPLDAFRFVTGEFLEERCRCCGQRKPEEKTVSCLTEGRPFLVPLAWGLANCEYQGYGYLVAIPTSKEGIATGEAT